MQRAPSRRPPTPWGGSRCASWAACRAGDAHTAQDASPVTRRTRNRVTGRCLCHHDHRQWRHGLASSRRHPRLLDAPVPDPVLPDPPARVPWRRTLQWSASAQHSGPRPRRGLAQATRTDGPHPWSLPQKLGQSSVTPGPSPHTRKRPCATLVPPVPTSFPRQPRFRHPLSQRSARLHVARCASVVLANISAEAARIPSGPRWRPRTGGCAPFLFRFHGGARTPEPSRAPRPPAPAACCPRSQIWEPLASPAGARGEAK